MMVKVRINNDETESLDLYNHVKSLGGVNGEDDIDSSEDDVSNFAKAIVGNFDMSSIRDHTLKYRIVMYSAESSLRLQDAVKEHVYKKNFGDNGTLDNADFADDYEPIIF
jgi:hypothetical protein